MSLPKDPVMLLSVVNTQLRDRFSSLEALADDYGVSPSEIQDMLKTINYEYNEELNQFK
ncbi:MAG: DUF4250 domain-containing protein [Lachnospiraceae bacterium]|nr:DUF4250 domain-containing protein [Lachnospiraceae bacterium]